MPIKYNESFKIQAVKSLRWLNDKGAIQINNVEIRTIRELVKVLEISTYTLYSWEKQYSNAELMVENEPDTSGLEIYASGGNLPAGKILPGEKKVVFGIGFWKFMAQNLGGIKGYGRMNIVQLKIAIGKRLTVS